MTECIVCKNQINDGATKCVHCDEYQNFRRYLKFPQNVLALLIALISVITVLIPILRSGHRPISEDQVSFSWLFAGRHSMTILMHNESDEDAFIQEIYLLDPKDSVSFYLDRLNRRPVIPKNSITPYEIPVYADDFKDFQKDLDKLVLWINWRTSKNEYTYAFSFCDSGECSYDMTRLLPIGEGFGTPENSRSVITDLYFGKNTPDGMVSDTEWKNFKDSVIATRFEGFTELYGVGAWTGADGQLINEKSSLVRIIHADTEVDINHIGELVTLYKSRFQQESVLLTHVYDAQIEFK